MTTHEAVHRPVRLSRTQRIRFAVVAVVALFVSLRVFPEITRAWQPVYQFRYATDDDGTVVRSSVLPLGDRVRIDHIPVFDRKPGLAGVAYTRENPDRKLPVEHAGAVRIVQLSSTAEPPVARFSAVLHLAGFAIALILGALLYLVRPSPATFGFFLFCIGGAYATTTADALVPMPWRPWPQAVHEALHGASYAGLLMFALGIGAVSAVRERIIGSGVLAAGMAIGILEAIAVVRRDYIGTPGEALHQVYLYGADAFMVATAAVLAWSIWQLHGAARHRAAWIALGLVVAVAARWVADAYGGRSLSWWLEDGLVGASFIAVFAVWYAVRRHSFFDVDFVVSRAVVYVAITAAVLAVLTGLEETLTYLFYNNTDVATGVLILISLIVGTLSGRLRRVVEAFVDRVFFRDRLRQNQRLEAIAARILQATGKAEVAKLVLDEVAALLELRFAGIFVRGHDGTYVLEERYAWPAEEPTAIVADDAMLAALDAARGTLVFKGRDADQIASRFEARPSLAAPLFAVGLPDELVVYGPNVGGFELDPEEQHLVARIIARAALALTGLELRRLREHVGPAAGLAGVQPATT